VPCPSIGGSILLQVTEGVDGIGEPEFRVLHPQCVRAQGDDIRQAGNQSCGCDFEVGFDASRGSNGLALSYRSFQPN